MSLIDLQQATVPSTASAHRPAVSVVHGLDAFRRDVVDGLSAPRKTLPCKWFYDERGSALFDAICELPEYYPTRTETAILEAHAAEMAELIGPDAVLIELGSGSSVKTRRLLDALASPAGYVPVDISAQHLARSARRLAAAYPHVPVKPLAADYTQAFTVPSIDGAERRVAYFPGSTIGNFHPDEAVAFLARLAELVSPGGGLLIGVDLEKSLNVLLPAYDDAAGVTAEFNRNLLHRINRELGGDVDVDAFTHEARWNPEAGQGVGRIEMHLVSLSEQTVHVAGDAFAFRAGESIHTECSYKHTLDGFAALAAEAGWRVERVWTDERRWFSVQSLITA